MFPILFSIGTFEFQAIWLIAAISALVFSFIVYHRCEEEVLPVDKVFDVLILSAISGFIFGKLVATFLALGELDFNQALRLTGVNFWGGVFGSLVAIGFISAKFKLSSILIADLVSLAGIPAAAFFSLGKLVAQNLTPVNIFILLWYTVGSVIFFQSAKKVQFPSFYLTISGFFFSVSQIVFEFSESSQTSARIFNLTISSLVLTIVVIFYYLRSGRNFVKDIKWLAQNLTKPLRRLKNILPIR